MAPLDTNRGFSNVDRTGDPVAYAQCMSFVASQPFVLGYKRRTHELLEPRDGSRLLDLGCGPGHDVLALATLVGPNGRAVGVDNSQTMLDTAREQAAQLRVPAEFALGDAHRLDFPDDSFDGCRADRVLHHLADPARALGELVRVARPGARIVVFSPDFDTATIDSPNPALTRTLVHLFCDTVQNGWMGRQLRRLFLEAGLVEVACESLAYDLTDYTVANRVLWLESTVAQARGAGLVPPEELNAWLAQLQEADRKGSFYATITSVLASGRKPMV